MTLWRKLRVFLSHNTGPGTGSEPVMSLPDPKGLVALDYEIFRFQRRILAGLWLNCLSTTDQCRIDRVDQ